MNADSKLKYRVLSVLGVQRLTSRQIASAMGYPNEHGIDSCLRGMWRRGEVRRSKPKAAFEPVTWSAA